VIGQTNKKIRSGKLPIPLPTSPLKREGLKKFFEGKGIREVFSPDREE
jgi:hypothetical protein